jgi:hypothetical protein
MGATAKVLAKDTEREQQREAGQCLRRTLRAADNPGALVISASATRRRPASSSLISDDFPGHAVRARALREQIEIEENR